MKFGLLYELQQLKPWSEDHDYRTMWDALEQIKIADRIGYEYVWEVEHHFLTEFSHSSSPEVFLSAVAQHTSKIRIGHGVVLLPPPFNHPFHIAERVAALDILSNGRVEFGTGRAITKEELGGFGVELSESRPMWEEVIRLIPQMWLNEEFPGYQGEYVKLPPRAVWPKPVQNPHPPMWMAATNPASYELAGRHGLGVLCFAFGAPEQLKPNIDAYRAAIRECTEPAGAFINENVGMAVVTHCGETRSEARDISGSSAMYYANTALEKFLSIAGNPGYEVYKDIVGDLGKQFEELSAKYDNLIDPLTDLGVFCIGDPDDCIATAQLYADQGVDQLITIQQVGTIPHEQVVRSINLFGETVIPKLGDSKPVARTELPSYVSPGPPVE